VFSLTNDRKLAKHMAMFRAFASIALVAIFSAPVTAEEPEFEVVGRVERAAPERPSLSLSILPRPGYRLLAGAPVLVHLAASGVDLPRTLYRREDAVDPRAEAPRFDIALAHVTPAARVDAELTFYICRAARCRPVTTRYGTSL
jgi:hypothetical protein